MGFDGFSGFNGFVNGFSQPKVASEWLQIGFKVAGTQKWFQNGFKIGRQLTQAGGRFAPAPLSLLSSYFEAILKPLLGARHFEANLKPF